MINSAVRQEDVTARGSARKRRQFRRETQLICARAFGDLPEPCTRKKPKVKRREDSEGSFATSVGLKPKYVNKPPHVETRQSVRF